MTHVRNADDGAASDQTRATGPSVDGERVAALKGETRVSVVLPAKDEATTVGGMVAALHEQFVQQCPLIDELIVIDSDSTDDTAQIARAAGATVYAAADIDTGFAAVPGKGEAIWRSLFVATGDIIVFLDADLTVWSPDFVPALLLPFFENGSVVLSKGFYRRPAGEGRTGGGRVTELIARPMIALHRPALADIVQPIGGEWAVRREAISAMPLPAGYAIDLAVLMGVYDSKGLDAIAQVDLGARAHVRQDLLALGVMSTQILAYIERRSGLNMGSTVWVPLRQFTPEGHERIERPVQIVIRPPVASVRPEHVKSARR